MTATLTGLPALEHDEILRYSRHLIIPNVGMEGQRRLKAARVLLIGAGGLGSPLALYLAAAGVGTLGIVDFDVVDYSNLQRQLLHGTADVGRSKLQSAKDRLEALNSEIVIETHETMLSSQNALDLFAPYDVIVDGADNFPTRYLLNDAAVRERKPVVHASILGFDGQLTDTPHRGGDTLYHARPGDGRVRGRYPGRVRRSSAYTDARLHRGRTLLGLAALGAGLLVGSRGRR